MLTDSNDPTMNAQKAEKLYQAWNGQITDAIEREKKYRQLGQKCVDMYEAKHPENTPYAILYSNTEVLIPAVYNSRPIPVVQRRYKDADPMGKAVADVSTRALKFLVDTESQDYDGFDDLMQPAVLDALVTNRGLTRFKYVASQTRMAECVYGEAVRWDKFFHGYARTWKKVPWIGFEWDMTEDEIRKNFPEVKLDLRNVPTVESENPAEPDRQSMQGVTLYKVYEIWDKRSKKIHFFSACHPKGPLKSVDDPLGLSGFFPVPRPMNFMKKITTLVPTPLYEHYKSQAAELNEITRRLKAIIRAVKFRGAYNAAVEGIEKMLQADDNELVPVENVASMPDGTGMDKLLWTVPTNELAATAQSLYQQREQVKTVIYEITGISDILRGASVASETATAQNIKNQWGTLRLRKMQKEVQRYCRDCLTIMLEIASNKFELQTLQQMTGAQYPTQEMKQKAEAMKQQLAMQTQLAQQAGQQPPQMPEIPPEVMALLAKPTWEEIFGLMQNELATNYKIDIETNSTIDAEASQDKQDISELLNALSQFLNGLGPLVEKGLMPFNIAKDMLLVIARRYNFGSQLEDSIQSMEQPKPPQEGPDPADQAKLAVVQAESQAKMQQMQMEGQLAKQEFEQKQALMVAEFQIKQKELALKEQELELQARAVGLKLQQQTAQHRQKMTQMAAAAEAKEKEPAHAAV